MGKGRVWGFPDLRARVRCNLSALPACGGGGDLRLHREVPASRRRRAFLPRWEGEVGWRVKERFAGRDEAKVRIFL